MGKEQGGWRANGRESEQGSTHVCMVVVILECTCGARTTFDLATFHVVECPRGVLFAAHASEGLRLPCSGFAQFPSVFPVLSGIDDGQGVQAECEGDRGS